MKTLIFIVGLVVSSTLIASSSPLKSNDSSINVDSQKTPTKTNDSCNDTIIFHDGKIIICSIYKIRKSDILYLTCDEEGETNRGVKSASFKNIDHYSKDGVKYSKPEKPERRKWKDRTILEKAILITLGMFLITPFVIVFIYLIFG